jgi:SAM-dependent methyltransferase
MAPRRLEIGPGEERLPGFETLDVRVRPGIDYVADAGHGLPFPDCTFELIYASHVLEHIPWYRTSEVLRDWVRVLTPGGRLEVWVPHATRICRAFLEAEEEGRDPFVEDPWFRLNPERDPCKWAAGRIFTWGDGTPDGNGPNWHRALFSKRYLRLVLEAASLSDVRELEPYEVRGYDHGWINLGMTGVKDA